MRELTVEEFRPIGLSLLSAFDAFCKDHHISYSLCGGTLIGAIRHGGYIPWDDDIDVMLLRSEYTKLRNAWKTAPLPDFELWTDEREKDFYLGESGKFLRKCDLSEELLRKAHRGPGIIAMDVFPIDGMPDETKARYKHFHALHKDGRRYHSLRKRGEKWFPLKWWAEQIGESIRHKILEYPDSKAHTVAFALGSTSDAERESFPRSYFTTFTRIPFETIECSAIQEYDAYLRHYYGDYMQLPPESERRAYHQRYTSLPQK